MSETTAVIVFIILAILFYKMIGRYIGIPLLCGIVGAAIGAIFGRNGSWMNFAYGGAIVGIIFCLIVDFDNAWKTLLGVCLGGALGWLIGLLFSGSMWSSVVCLAGALIGACVLCPAALDDISRQSNRTYTRQSDTSSGGKTSSAHYCCQCSHYNNYYHTCDNHGQQYIDPYSPSCIAFTR